MILKSNHGGEGSLVYAVHTPEQARNRIEILRREERAGFKGILVQDLVPGANRTLRVVVMDMCLFAYWRVQDNPEVYTHNLATGGRLDQDSDPGLQRKGIGLVRKLLSRARIDLAGMDMLFTPAGEPLLLEINYTFGRRELGAARSTIGAFSGPYTTGCAEGGCAWPRNPERAAKSRACRDHTTGHTEAGPLHASAHRELR